MLVPYKPQVVTVLQNYCDVFGHPQATIWDRYDCDDRAALVHKLKIIFAAPPERTSPTDDDSDKLALANEAAAYNQVFNLDASVTDCTATMEKDFVRLVDAIWAQRKYCNGILLMSPVFVASVAHDVHERDGVHATEFVVRPIFRIAKCFASSTAGGTSTANCCSIFVDESARVYQNWNDYVENNELGQRNVLVAPVAGIYRPDANGNVQLCSSHQHYSRMRAIQSTVTYASWAGLGAVVTAPLLPAAIVTGGIATGVACAGYGIASGVNRLLGRSQHEQSVGLDDRESRGVWLGVVGNTVGLAAGAGMSVVQQLARNGAQLGRTSAALATCLQVASIATNGVGVANGIYGMWTDGRAKLSYAEALQLSASLFLITHSMRNFQTARDVYQETQASTLQTYAGQLSKRQQRAYRKMLRETIRRGGGNVDRGHADVIRSLRTISDPKAFFRDVQRINGKLNAGGVRISFNGRGEAVLNGEIPFQPQQLRADLRGQTAAASAEVLSNLTGGVGSGESSNFAPYTAPNRPPAMGPGYGNWVAKPVAPLSGLRSISDNLTETVERRIGSLGRWQLVQIVWQYYVNNRELLHDRLRLHFDDRFVQDVGMVMCFLAEQAQQVLRTFWQTVAEDVLYGQLNRIYESRWLELAVRVGCGSVRQLYDGFREMLDDIWQYVHNADGLRETVLGMLEVICSRVVRRLLHLSQISFGAIVAMGLDEFPAFEAYFGEVLEAVTQMAMRAGFADLSLYVLLMGRPEMDALHQRMTRFYTTLSDRTSTAMACTKCAGRFSVMPVQ